MAAAGAILVRTLKLVESKIRPGVTTLDLDRAAEQLHPLAGRDARVQGLPRLPRLAVHVAERDGRARDPGRLRAQARRHHLRGLRRRPRRLGRRCGADVHGRRRRGGHGPLAQAAGDHEAVALRRRAAVPAGQPPRRRLQRGADHGGGGGPVDRPLARRPRHRPLDARGPADPELRRAGPRPAPGGGHGARRGADGHRRPPPDPDGRRQLVDLLAGRVAGRALRVHDRRHGRRTSCPHALARSGRRRRPCSGCYSGWSRLARREPARAPKILLRKAP